MRQIDKFSAHETFTGEDGDSLRVSYDNRGEPYREGITFAFEEGTKHVDVFIDKYEALRLADLITKLYPPRN
ncbi:hypothetical protein [Dyella sp. ASV21]|uniref:hypothetical protein n=1 Tax=Dyella sp. ASV21 TaxID=2795114 RepID=UPI0018EC6EF3|nr:hypothetical protein [Dyella sp. ASV21]